MLRSLRFLVLLAALPLSAKHVVFVDNSRPPGGNGTQANPFTSIGGGGQATNEGSGIAAVGGDGEVTIDRFPLTGSFAAAVRIADRRLGAVTFRNGSSIRTDDAADDAISVSNMPASAPVTF